MVGVGWSMPRGSRAVKYARVCAVKRRAVKCFAYVCGKCFCMCAVNCTHVARLTGLRKILAEWVSKIYYSRIHTCAILYCFCIHTGYWIALCNRYRKLTRVNLENWKNNYKMNLRYIFSKRLTDRVFTVYWYVFPRGFYTTFVVVL